MKKQLLLPLLLGSALTPAPAFAQDTPSVEDQLAAMQAEIERLSQRVQELEAERSATRAPSNEVVAPPEPLESVAPVVAAAPAPAIAFGGARTIEAEGGWSFKPFGRLNIDAGTVNAPDSTSREDGFGSEIRRARLGMSGDIPGGFGYKIEVDFAGNEVTVTDAIITYEDGPLTVNVGQHNNFQSLEELTSSRWSSFIERAAFTDAFGFERRLGVSAEVDIAEGILLQAGLFRDNIADLPDDSWSGDLRAVASPVVGDAQLHFGGSVHYTELGDDETARYRQRPLVHFTSERFVDTRNFDAESELGAGLEAGVITGPFHAVAEGFWQSAERVDPAFAEPSFFGGYAEAGLFLTPGDSRGYRGGKFERTRPANPVDEGGMGALQVNLRYDYLDLNDAGIIGGKQNGYFASLVWVPTDYTRLLVNYGRLEYDDAAYPTTSGSTDYAVDVIGMRAQIDF
ncbi:porin [Aurantiacibacter poecillastricola]|uniref:porin n=1 Tax=Aurantiacibacter poecillastricola TaxID=3064385 RepID=UPI00273DE429|nr:porin [Aurantiacibacter sp. 219JJ12-13]MDP5261906.1 porin [Aurantiacibacter sp. 219JJ12-13]